MKVIFAVFLIAWGLSPVLAQLYSYRNKEGKLVITDRPLRGKNYKLVDTYIPKDVLERRKRAEAEIARNAGRKRGKYVLTEGQIRGLAHPIAKSMGVDPALVMAVIEVESGGDARAKSSKGAMGLMQLIPDTAKRFGVKNAWDPRQNVRGGVRYLQFLLSYFEGNVNYVLAAYNAGENAVDKYGGIPPFKETRRYIHKIRRLYTTGTLPFKQTAARRHSALVAKKETGHSGNTPTARLN